MPVSQWAPEGRSVIVTFRPDGAEDAKEENHRQSLVPNPASVGHSTEQKMRLESLRWWRGGIQQEANC